jgi:hypothetical protein
MYRSFYLSFRGGNKLVHSMDLHTVAMGDDQCLFFVILDFGL